MVHWPPPPLSGDDPRVTDPKLLDAFNYQKLFEEKKCDVYRACEWGQIRRTYESKRGGPIAGKRPTVVGQGIYVRPDSPVNAPIQMADTAVGAQFPPAAHYPDPAIVGGVLPP